MPRFIDEVDKPTLRRSPLKPQPRGQTSALARSYCLEDMHATAAACFHLESPSMLVAQQEGG